MYVITALSVAAAALSLHLSRMQRRANRRFLRIGFLHRVSSIATTRLRKSAADPDSISG